jgi:hypothetical protein
MRGLLSANRFIKGSLMKLETGCRQLALLLLFFLAGGDVELRGAGLNWEVQPAPWGTFANRYAVRRRQ